MATNSSPARIVRESIETPATRARASSPVPGRVPRAPATCAIVHRISSSKGSSYPSTPRLVLFSSFEGSSFREVSHRLAPVDPRPEALSSRLITSALGAKPGAIPRLAFPLAVPRAFEAAFPEGAPRHLTIAKFERPVRHNLIILVPLSSQQHNVSCARFVHGHTDGLLTVRLDQILAGCFLQSHDDVADDFQRIFTARIVARKNRQVAQPAGDFSHHGSLGAVLLAAAPKEGNDSALGIQLARRSN